MGGPQANTQVTEFEDTTTVIRDIDLVDYAKDSQKLAIDYKQLGLRLKDFAASNSRLVNINTDGPGYRYLLTYLFIII